MPHGVNVKPNPADIGLSLLCFLCKLLPFGRRGRASGGPNFCYEAKSQIENRCVEDEMRGLQGGRVGWGDGGLFG